MNTKESIIACYDKTAKNYAEKFMDELEHKHFDRFLLAAFASENKLKRNFIDLGCGPGQIANFLFKCGYTEIIGVDISSEMVKVATQKNQVDKVKIIPWRNRIYNNRHYQTRAIHR